MPLATAIGASGITGHGKRVRLYTTMDYLPLSQTSEALTVHLLNRL